MLGQIFTAWRQSGLNYFKGFDFWPCDLVKDYQSVLSPLKPSRAVASIYPRVFRNSRGQLPPILEPEFSRVTPRGKVARGSLEKDWLQA